MTNPIIGLFLPFVTIVLSQFFVVIIASYNGRIIVKPQTVLEEPFSYPQPKASFVTELRLDWDEKNKRVVYEKLWSEIVYADFSDFLNFFWLDSYINRYSGQETWLEIGADVPYRFLDSVLAVQAKLGDSRVFFLAKRSKDQPPKSLVESLKPLTGIRTKIPFPDSLSIRWKNIHAELDSVLFAYYQFSPPAPPSAPDIYYHTPNETYKIAITKQGSTIKGKSYDLKTWKKFWYQYFKQPKTDTGLRLSLDLKFYTAPNVPYQQWLEVFSTILIARRHRLEEVSDFMFGQEYDILSNEQKSLVSRVISSINFSFYVLE